jgi:outer membrane lipoprotein-sorting protein
MLKIIISMVLCVVSSIVHADVLKNLDSFLQNASITANFTQTVYGNKKNRISQGTMQIDRPNKFRWE